MFTLCISASMECAMSSGIKHVSLLGVLPTAPLSSSSWREDAPGMPPLPLVFHASAVRFS